MFATTGSNLSSGVSCITSKHSIKELFQDLFFSVKFKMSIAVVVYKALCHIEELYYTWMYGLMVGQIVLFVWNTEKMSLAVFLSQPLLYQEEIYATVA